jgi:hypothetical protein
MITFGQGPTYQSGEGAQLAVSGDKKAFTLTFSNLQAVVDGEITVATRAYSLVLPLEGDEKKATIAFHVNAGVLTKAAATATLAFDVNGQTAVSNFPANTDVTHVQTLKVAADMPFNCRMSVWVVAGRDGKNRESAAFLNVIAIDAEIQPSQPS